MSTIQPVDVLGKKWCLVVSSSLEDVDQIIKPIFRDAVVLRDITDLAYEEIAEVLGVSLGTVKSRILRGREALREELAGSIKNRPALRLTPKLAE